MMTFEQKKEHQLTGENIITIGMFDQDSKRQELTKSDYLNVIESEICKRGFCATILTDGIWGIYRHDDGTVVKEPSIRVELCGLTRREVLPMIRVFREKFNQESILYRFTPDQIFDLVNIDYSDDD